MEFFLSLFSYISLFIFGTLFWSFASVLIFRWKYHQKWILTGRSICPKCKHILGWKQLIPIFSWCFYKWKCAFCGEKISPIYPILEFSMGIIFILMGYSAQKWGWNFQDIPTIFLLIFGFLSVVYTFYDILFLEIPDEIFIIFVITILFLTGISFFIPFQQVFFGSANFTKLADFFAERGVAAMILYTFLFIQILIPWGIFLLQKWRYKDILELLLLFFIFPFIVLYEGIKKYIFPKKSLQNSEKTQEDIPTWIGAWDLVLAIIIGFTLWIFHSIIAFFLAYLIGSVFGILNIVYKKYILKQWSISSEIPFWPFLASGSILAIVFFENISAYKNELFSLFL